MLDKKMPRATMQQVRTVVLLVSGLWLLMMLFYYNNGLTLRSNTIDIKAYDDEPYQENPWYASKYNDSSSSINHSDKTQSTSVLEFAYNANLYLVMPRATMQQVRTVVLLVSGLWLLMMLFYYNNGLTLRSNTIDIKAYDDEPYQGSEDYLINTPGCSIPNYAKALKFIEAKDTKSSCGKRSVFIYKDAHNITFRIDHDLLQKYYKAKPRYQCCYRFASRSTESEKEDSQLTYSECKKFENGTTVRLEEEVVFVACSITARKPFYEDAYMFVKRIKMSPSKSKKTHWNVLVLGMDTMSRGRFLINMPKTAKYFKQHGWLDYKGYQKVGFNTFPNLMSFLTGLKMTTVNKKCVKTMSNCNGKIIWSKFKKQGYATAYGEEFLSLPDTFSSRHGFVTPPTDHYMRPLFLTNETRTGNLVCTKKVPSAISALNYALDFVNTYRDNKFFGMFWLNSYSHNLENLPALFDNALSIFLDKLTKMDAISKTFIFFLSDHGTRYGPMRLQVESYYEERLPMFFVKVPRDFKMLHLEASYNLKLNENRLTTPYDLYGTFVKILQLSSGFYTEEKSEACPNCTSLFDVQSEYRTCASASVDEKWCSCHNLTSVDIKARGAATSLKLAVAYIQNVAKSVKTKRCTRCKELKLQKVLRAHVDVDEVQNKTKYVIAFQMSPHPTNVIYEASVLENQKGFSIIQPTNTISKYNANSDCVIHIFDREYCVCEKIKKCH